MKSLGILFEQQKILLVCLKKGLKGISLYNHRILSLKDLKPEERDDFIAGSVEAFIEETRVSRKNIFLGIPRDQAVFKYLDLPLAIEENLGNVLHYELDRYTPFATEDVYLDYQIIDRDRERETIKVLLVAVKRALLDHCLMTLERLNLRSRSAEITSTALFNLQAQGKVQKKISLEKMSLQKMKVWFQKKEVHEKGEEEKENEKDALIKKLLSVFSRTKADKKIPSLQGIKALSYIEEHCLELNIIQDDMLAYSKFFPLYPPKGIERVSFLKDRISSELDLAAMSLNGLRSEAIPLILTGTELDSGLVEELRLTGDLDPHLLNEGMIGVKGDLLSLLSPAIGIAIKGLKEVPLDINLIPVNIRPREIKYLKEMIAGILLLISSIAGGAYYYDALSKDEAYLDKLTRDVERLRVEVMAEEKMQQEAEAIKKKINVLEGIKKKDVSKIAILKELTAIIPLDVWLTDFSYREKEGKVELSGFAFSASNLISILEDSPLFEKVQFTSPIVKGGSVKEYFRLEAAVTHKGG